MKVLFLLVSSLVAACTQPNPNRCCTSATDCDASGIPIGTTCNDGLVCRGNQCIAETCTNGTSCEAAAPYCVGGLCASGCTTDPDCPGFAQTAIDQYCVMGSCVECRMAADCGADHPICDANACRACALDSECASGACADNGTCVDDTTIVYVDGTNGFDAGTCTRQLPCKTLQFGIQNALPMRSHIVMAPGTYVENVSVDGATTTATSVTIHGGGATLEPVMGGDLPTMTTGNVATTIHDVTFAGNAAFGAAIESNSAPCTIRRARFQGVGGVVVGINMTIEDAEFSDNTAPAITVGGVGGHLLIDRVSIHGGVRGIFSNASGAIVSVTNLLVFGTSGLAVDLTGASGIVRFSTVSDAGAGGTGPRVFQCSSGLVVESSIIWTPGQTAIGGGCLFNTTIAGPTSVTGTMNTDPMFVDPTHHDYHLGPGSPAKDLAGMGPTVDLDGHPRPQGSGFDIGAFEAP